jgi:AcrR family transcriptional regulator
LLTGNVLGYRGGVSDGLRERKKRELRRRLSTAALMLARERGVSFRVQDVVDRVGVSRRTFSNYFAGKEEALADHHLQRITDTARALRERPADEPFWDALTAAVLAPFADVAGARTIGPEEHRVNWVAVLRTPELQAAVAAGSRAATDELTRAVADRTALDPSRDPYPGLVAGTVVHAQLSTLEFWLHADPPVELGPLMRDTLARLGAGLRTPSDLALADRSAPS